MPWLLGLIVGVIWLAEKKDKPLTGFWHTVLSKRPSFDNPTTYRPATESVSMTPTVAQQTSSTLPSVTEGVTEGNLTSPS